MIEAIAFATICFIRANGSFLYRLKKGIGGAVLFITLLHAYTILQPLLPTETDYLLQSTIWGVLFAYAVPNSTKKTDKEQENDDENKTVDDDI